MRYMSWWTREGRMIRSFCFGGRMFRSEAWRTRQNWSVWHIEHRTRKYS